MMYKRADLTALLNYVNGDMMKRKIKALVCLVVTSLSLFACSSEYEQKIEYNKSLAEEYVPIDKTLASYFSSAYLNMYEYTDDASIEETLMYYYFEYNQMTPDMRESAMNWISSQTDKMEVSDETIDKLVNIIFFESLICGKYELKCETKIAEKIPEVYTFLEMKKSDIYLLNSLWKVYSCAQIANNDLEQIGLKINQVLSEVKADDKLSSLSIDIINSIMNKTEELVDVESVYKQIVNMYYEDEIDIESVIIYLSFLETQKSVEVSDSILNAIADDIEQHYAIRSLYVRMMSLKILEDEKYDRVNELKTLTVMATPVNKDGIAPEKAILKTNYKRLFQFSEMCTLLGEQIFGEADAYKTFEDVGGITSAEEMYYACVLSYKYNDIEVEKEEVTEFVSNMIGKKIESNNIFSFIMTIRSANVMDIKCDDLISQVSKYLSKHENEYVFYPIWKAELSGYQSKKNLDKDTISQIEELLLSYEGEQKLEACYQLVYILKHFDKKLSDTFSKELEDFVKNYYVEYSGFGGFYSNEEFCYIDVSKTYECLIVLDYVS